MAAAIFSGAILVPLFFWRWAARRNWPPLLAESLSRRPRFAAIDLCSTNAAFAYGIDFTARIVFVGPRTFEGWPLWSIARIEERFSGLQWWAPDFIILEGFFKPGDKSKRYFVEGTRTWTALTRFLPVIQPLPCGRTQPLELAWC